ncbi:MAG: exodeoxyribonuclease VII small subunit [Bacteroidales bacterium]|jgi:exodeoxyribonuclease VII small subunit|nr:exodeoxyribonuclease VII small subunit [Bacteroidales bacterium]
MDKSKTADEKASAATTLTYEKAYTELQKIAEEIENEDVLIDILAERVKRASELVEFCQTKLKSTKEEVDKVLAQMSE